MAVALALSVLAPNVPVPAFDTGRHDPSDFGSPSALVYHPAVRPGQEAFVGSSGVGAEPHGASRRTRTWMQSRISAALSPRGPRRWP
jgi:hypothetical protein